MAKKQPSPQPVTVKRLVYKEIKEGDRRKFLAQSNDTASGGGARDLRFSPYDKFRDVFAAMFPQQKKVTRKRGGIQKSETVLLGEFCWMDNGVARRMQSQFEPPTDARSLEGRIARVHTYPCFADLPGTGDGMVLLLLIQQSDGTVWPRFTTENSLSRPGWDPAVAGAILNCIRAKRRANVAVVGFIDFENGKQYCNGD